MSDQATLAVLCAAAVVIAAMLWRAINEGRGQSESPSTNADATPSDSPDDAPTAGAPSEGEEPLPKVVVEEDEGLELTRLTLSQGTGDDDDEEPTKLETVVPIIYDDDAAVDEPTQPSAYILVSAVGQTDRGKRRKRNEDSYLVLEDPPVYLVADGMGGYAGGQVASALAVERVHEMFDADGGFDASALVRGLPRRGAELVQAVQSANRVIWDRAQSDRDLREMGTTIVAARFSPNKQRLYIAHVGDSRCYLLRDGVLHQVTTDHTAGEQGVSGPLAASLTRALGIRRKVVVDLILGKPRGSDRYLLCSDGLSKMLTDDQIRDELVTEDDPEVAVRRLIDAANEHGGKDNVTVIIVDVERAAAAVGDAAN